MDYIVTAIYAVVAIFSTLALIEMVRVWVWSKRLRRFRAEEQMLRAEEQRLLNELDKCHRSARHL